MTENQAAYVATIENIVDDVEKAEYIDYMTGGAC